MTANTSKTLRLLVAMAVISVAATDLVVAQNLSLNYESLSSLEDPLATEVGDVTLALTGLLDPRLTLSTEGEDAADEGLIGNFQVSAQTQFSNRWRVELAYFGQDASGRTSVFRERNGYTDNAALSVSGAWGAVLGGNISGAVRERTRRLRGVGNASLAFDDALGELAINGVGYEGRFGPWVVAALVDEDGNSDIGAMLQRPTGSRDYRLTLRATEGTYTADDGSTQFNTRGAGIVGEVIYGSTLFDAGAGYERFSWSGQDLDRWYVSSGIRKKIGVISLSLEGHYGRVEGADERAVALGFQYDLARGLSVNLGLNHAKARATLGTMRFMDARDTNAVLSFRYSF